MATSTDGFDGKRAEAFADRMVGIMNGAAIALMTSVGHAQGCSTPCVECHRARARASPGRLG